MRGTMTIIRPNLPGDLHYIVYPPSGEDIERMLGGPIDIISHWDQWVDFSGRLVPATVLANGDWRLPIQPFNLVATAAWHYIAKAKGHILQANITGPVAVFTGDEEFFSRLLSD